MALPLRAAPQLARPLRSVLSGFAARASPAPIVSLPGSSNRPIARFPSPCQVRHSSHSPVGPDTSSGRKAVTMTTLRKLYRQGEPITMLTAHDFPSAYVAESAGMDMILVGDSLAMVALGMGDTSEVLLDEMLLHCRSVARAAKKSFKVGDIPMGSYEISPEQAVQSAIRIIKEGRMQAVKLEGGADMAPTIKRITSAGIPVVGHIGLTPQRQHALGGFKTQGKSAAGALKLLDDAVAVQEAGAFMIVLEAVPPEVANVITQKLRVPTIGIGASNECSGQVLVQIDMTGNFPPGRKLPKFAKQYANVYTEALQGIEAYRDEVKARTYPSEDHTYSMNEEELTKFKKTVDERPQK